MGITDTTELSRSLSQLPEETYNQILKEVAALKADTSSKTAAPATVPNDALASDTDCSDPDESSIDPKTIKTSSDLRALVLKRITFFRHDTKLYILENGEYTLVKNLTALNQSICKRLPKTCNAIDSKIIRACSRDIIDFGLFPDFEAPEPPPQDPPVRQETAHSLANTVKSSGLLANLGGRLHRFNGYYFTPVTSSDEVQSFIYDFTPQFFPEVPSSILKACANTIYKFHRLPELLPSEVRGYLGFKNGIYLYNPQTGTPHAFCSFQQLQSPPPTTIVPPTTSTGNTLSDRFKKQNTVPTFESWSPEISALLSSPNTDIDSALPIKITHLLDVNFIGFEQLRFLPPPNSTLRFFSDIANGDAFLINRLWEMLACILVPDPSLKKIFLFQGPSNTGKSVLGNFIKSFFLEENVSSVTLSQLHDKFPPAHQPGIFLNLSMDIPSTAISPSNVATLKVLTGSDSITLTPSRQKPYSYKNLCRFIFATNHPIALKENDPAFLNRLVCIPFNHSITNPNPNLLGDLLKERDVVAAWAIQYYYPIIKAKNFKFSDYPECPQFSPKLGFSEKVTEKHKTQIQEFADRLCIITENQDDYIYTQELYDLYCNFCKDHEYTLVCALKQFSLWFNDVVGNRVTKKRRNGIATTSEGEKRINQSCYYGLKTTTKP